MVVDQNSPNTHLTAPDYLVYLRLRFAKQVSLHEIAAKHLKTFKLLFGFNAFSNDPHIEALGHAGNQFNDIQCFILRGYRIHKGFVYFDFVKIQFTQS